MRKLGIVLIIGLLLVSGIVAAMAYTTATVQSSMKLQIVSTEDAKLALIPNEVDHGDVIWTSPDGVMVLDFSPGTQPQGRYFYEHLFTIGNNSGKDVAVYWGWMAGSYQDWDWDDNVLADLVAPSYLKLRMERAPDQMDPWPGAGASDRWIGNIDYAPAYDTHRKVDLQIHADIGDLGEGGEGFLVIYAVER